MWYVASSNSAGSSVDSPLAVTPTAPIPTEIKEKEVLSNIEKEVGGEVVCNKDLSCTEGGGGGLKDIKT